MTQTADVIQFPACTAPPTEQERPAVTADVGNGYVRIANQVQDKLCVVDLTGRQFRVVNAVIRRTYGFQRKTAYLKAPFIADLVNYSGDPGNIRTDIRLLKSRKILVDRNGELGPNPVVSEWILTKQVKNNPVTGRNQPGRKQPVTELKTTPLQVENDPVAGQKQPPYKDTSKETLKDTFKETAALTRSRIFDEPSTSTFTMNLEWQPSNRFADLCKARGVNMSKLSPDHQEDTLNDFRCWWSSNPHKPLTQSGWDNKLAQRVKQVIEWGTKQQRPESPPAATQQTKRAAVSAAVMDVTDTDW